MHPLSDLADKWPHLLPNTLILGTPGLMRGEFARLLATRQKLVPITLPPTRTVDDARVVSELLTTRRSRQAILTCLDGANQRVMEILLKDVEENQHNYLIMWSNSSLPTLASRCQTIRMPVPRMDEAVAQVMWKHPDVSESRAAQAVALDPVPGRALQSLEALEAGRPNALSIIRAAALDDQQLLLTASTSAKEATLLALRVFLTEAITRRWVAFSPADHPNLHRIDTNTLLRALPPLERRSSGPAGKAYIVGRILTPARED